MAVSRRTFMKLAAGGLGSALLQVTGCARQDANWGTSHRPTPGNPLTPPEQWYVISFQGIQEIDLEHYRFELYGLVDTPRRWGLEDLKERYESVWMHDTLACVGNSPGGPLRSSGLFRGIRMRDLLQDAGISDRATSAFFTGIDGFVAMRRIEDLLDENALLVYEMGTREDDMIPLRVENGFPMRLLTPGYYGYTQAKWIDSIEIVDDGHFHGVLSRSVDYFDGKMQLASGFTQPRDGWELEPGVPFDILGWAYGDGRTIERIEVRFDKGPWQEAEIAWNLPDDELPSHVWSLWRLGWTPEPGRHRLSVRATYADGDTQQMERDFPYSGGSIYDITVQVGEA